MSDTVQYTLERATEFRNAGYAVEVYMNDGKMAKKLTYANKLGIPYVVIIGADEKESGVFNLKDMATGEQHKISSAEEAKSITKKYI